MLDIFVTVTNGDRSEKLNRNEEKAIENQRK